MTRTPPGTRSLRTFVAAARHCHFTRAAQEVGLTPAAVSHQVKEIEDQLGFALFTRGRQIALTPAGAAWFEAAQDALDILQRGAVRARRLACGEGPLRVSVGPRFASHWLLTRLDRWRALHPDIELSFDICETLRDFARDDVDVAIRFGAGQYPDTRADRLFGARVIPVCNPSLFAQGTPPATPRDLLRYTLCHAECLVDGVVWPNWSQWMLAAGVQDFDASRCLVFTDASHVIQTVLDGAAIGLAEEALVRHDLAQGRLVRLFDLELGMAPHYGYHLVYPEDRAQDVRIQAFRAWLLEEVATCRAPTATAARLTANLAA